MPLPMTAPGCGVALGTCGAHNASAISSQYELVPFALEAYGAVDSQAVKYGKELGSISSASGRVSEVGVCHECVEYPIVCFA